MDFLNVTNHVVITEPGIRGRDRHEITVTKGTLTSIIRKLIGLILSGVCDKSLPLHTQSLDRHRWNHRIEEQDYAWHVPRE